ncbi:MAG: FtsX-like permease family protein [Pedobacter agri]|uniref:ABC transporter permease n=3 Tax=Pedobacter agri TaxID=454586 RepID=A0A9X3DIN2_9SPHI|nr:MULTISPECIES: FtsX-like permease family protein [Pedobacter]AZI27830.1 ABC transporter permease [Pedobacter sp. G11]MCX3266835.1 ABC transporter permease [Pedobacter agri]
MNFEYFIAGRIAIKSERTFSKLIVRIAIVGVMLSLAVMILSIAIIKGFKTEIQDKVRGYLGDVQITRYDLNNSFEHSPFVLDSETAKKLKENPDVEYFYPFATKPAILSANEEIEGINFKGVDKSYNWDYIKQHIISGTIIDFSDSTAAMQELLVSNYTANRLKLKTGDDFIMYFVQNQLRPRKFKIVGIYDIGVEDIDKSFVLGNLNIIKRLNNWNANQIGGVEIRIKNFKDLNKVSLEIFESLPQNLRSFSIVENFPNIFNWMSLLDVNTNVLLILMLIVGVINMVTALLIMILEKTNMIGMLKSFGASNWSIMKIFLYNAAYLIGIGLLLGNILGLGLGFFQQATHIFKLNQSSYFLTYAPIEIHFIDVLGLNVLTVVVCLIVLIIPSLLISKVSPLKAIRFK